LKPKKNDAFFFGLKIFFLFFFSIRHFFFFFSFHHKTNQTKNPNKQRKMSKRTRNESDVEDGEDIVIVNMIVDNHMAQFSSLEKIPFIVKQLFKALVHDDIYIRGAARFLIGVYLQKHGCFNDEANTLFTTDRIHQSFNNLSHITNGKESVIDDFIKLNPVNKNAWIQTNGGFQITSDDVGKHVQSYTVIIGVEGRFNFGKSIFKKTQ